MKTKHFISILTIAATVTLFVAPTVKLFSQRIVSLKTFTLPKEAAQGTLIGFLHDESSGNFKVIYSVGKKKAPRFETFIFDGDLNFVHSETPTDMEVAQAQELYPFFDFENNVVKDEGSITSRSRKVIEGEIPLNDGGDIVYQYSMSEEGFVFRKTDSGSVVFEKTIPFSEFEEKFRFPPNGSKGKPCNEKANKISIAGHYIGDDGSIFIIGQNRDKGGVMGAMQWQQTGHADTKYRDCFIFHIDDQGNLLSQYSFDTKWIVNTSPCEQYFLKGTSGDKAYWMILNNFYDTMLGAGFTYFKPIICQIDLTNQTMGNVFDGQKELAIKEFKYLDPIYPFITLGQGTVVFLGKDKAKGAGKVISFVKMILD